MTAHSVTHPVHLLSQDGEGRVEGNEDYICTRAISLRQEEGADDSSAYRHVCVCMCMCCCVAHTMNAAI